MNRCAIGDCARTIHSHSHSMCRMHYARWTKHGDTSDPFTRRLFARIHFTSDCWEWMGSRVKLGYGRVGRNGDTHLVHRAVYQELVGAIPEGLELDHLCRNPPCVNPDHLEPVTHAENVRRGLAGQLHDTCKHGHDLNDPANVYRHTRGRRGRKCKPCAIRNSKARHLKKKKEQQDEPVRTARTPR